jgi:ubiquinone/menaquinone biosynthesis methyltransferase
MFDGIARRYDLMNRLMTGGVDGVARTITARAVAGPTVRIAVDMGCGTGDLAFALARAAPNASVVGLDFSAGMLGVAARKRLRDASGARVPLVQGDGTALCLAPGSADALVSAWVLRNVGDLAQTFREARRALRPGGRAAFLELTPVKSRVFGPLFRMYFHGAVPWVGERMSGHAAAYTYLPESVDRFPDAETIAAMLGDAGFCDVTIRRLAFGTLALHVGTAPEVDPRPVAPALSCRWPVRADDWDRAVEAIPGAHALQSWGWGEFRRTSGWEVERVVWERDGVPVAAASILRRRLPLPGLGVAYVPKGPIVDPGCRGAWPVVLEYLAAFAKAQRCIFVKVDPDVTRGDRRVEGALAHAGFHRSRHQVQYPATMVLPLDGDDAELQARMRQTWRRYVRKAEREGVTAQSTKNPTDEEVSAFLRLYRETADRDGFVIRDANYYRDALKMLCPSGLATVHVARLKTEIVAVAVVLTFGAKAWYLWGATSAAGLDRHAMYLVQWTAMRAARDAGCTAYDMWGAPEDPSDEADPLRGVAWFKSGFGASHVRWTGAWDHAPWPVVYRAWLEALPRAVTVIRRLRGERTGHAIVNPVQLCAGVSRARDLARWERGMAEALWGPASVAK